MFYRLISIVLSVSLISCSSTTAIRAVNSRGDVDRGVRIYIDGNYKGKGETSHSDTKIVGMTTHIQLKKEGCQNQTFSLSRSERLSVGALIGGIFFWIPLLWVMGYNPSRNYEFQCE